MRPYLALVLAGLVIGSFDPQITSAAKTKKLKNSLLSIAEPSPGKPANAHPFVNVVVLFGRLSDGTPADPATFRAKMGREDITKDFIPVVDARGAQIGVRAKIEAHRVKLGRRPRNALRLSVLAVKSGKKRIKDVDRVRFGALEGPNGTCTAQGDADTEVIVPGIPVKFTSSAGTTDPDRDELTYQWDFGDGTTSTEADPQKIYDTSAGVAQGWPWFTPEMQNDDALHVPPLAAQLSSVRQKSPVPSPLPGTSHVCTLLSAKKRRPSGM